MKDAKLTLDDFIREMENNDRLEKLELYDDGIFRYELLAELRRLTYSNALLAREVRDRPLGII